MDSKGVRVSPSPTISLFQHLGVTMRKALPIVCRSTPEKHRSASTGAYHYDHVPRNWKLQVPQDRTNFELFHLIFGCNMQEQFMCWKLLAVRVFNDHTVHGCRRYRREGYQAATEDMATRQ
jgi:hypothetical protein